MPSKSPLNPGRRIQTRRSEVHGNGVFAVQDIAEGETIVEYKGEVISWKEALRRHPHDPAQPNHTFYFHIDDKHVIDGKVNGNAARWINHACAPNCEADEQDGRIFIKALRDIAAGEELNYDYGLIIDEEYTPELLADYPCWCGAETCRGTLLSPKGDDEGAKAEPVKKKKKKKAEKAATAGRDEKTDKAGKKARVGKADKLKGQGRKDKKAVGKSGKKADKS
ncbi:SET domain-containing protein [Variovorax rhizosphaerae]|uniref:SET domain-containing protein-lysine N-methyltransferase n=1 Tax=Variovorax rhizosphaerae TaxID=1836200 RepID=A0ABU8WCJ7_9BURK